MFGLNPVSMVRTKILAGVGIAGLLAVIGLLIWGSLEHNWRVAAEDRLNSIRITIDTALGNEKPTKIKDLPGEAEDLADKYDTALEQRDSARQVVEIQSGSITALENETATARRLAESNQRLIEATTRERDRWIARAKTAETRAERLTAEKELEECETVLDSLYQRGF